MTPPGPGRTLFTFVRHWSRRLPTGDDAVATQGRHVLVTEAVDALTLRGVGPTVNAIAAEIGIDQSGASRLARAATDAGYLTTEASTEDARRRHSAVTEAGREMLQQAHLWQERVFTQLTEGWSEERRASFRRDMAELVERSHDAP